MCAPSLYITDDDNVAIFPGPNGHFSSLDIHLRGHYEVHGNDAQPVATQSDHRFRFLRTTPPSVAAGSPNPPTFTVPRANMVKTFQRYSTFPVISDSKKLKDGWNCIMLFQKSSVIWWFWMRCFFLFFFVRLWNSCANNNSRSVFVADLDHGKLRPNRTVVVRFSELYLQLKVYWPKFKMLCTVMTLSSWLMPWEMRLLTQKEQKVIQHKLTLSDKLILCSEYNNYLMFVRLCLLESEFP